MSEFSMKISANPRQIASLKSHIQARSQEIPASLHTQAKDRDISILAIVVTAVTSQAIGLLFSLLKDFISSQLKGEKKSSFAIQTNDGHIEISKEADLARLEALRGD